MRRDFQIPQAKIFCPYCISCFHTVYLQHGVSWPPTWADEDVALVTGENQNFLGLLNAE